MTVLLSPDATTDRLANIRRDSRRAMLAVGVVSAVLNVLLLAGSLYMMLVYDMVMPSHSLPTLFGLALILLTAYAFQGVLEFIRSRLLLHFSAMVDVDLNRDVHRLIGTLSRAQAGGDATVPMRDLDQLRAFLSGTGPGALVDMPWMVLFMGVLFLLHPLIGLTVLLGGGLLVGITFMAERITAKPSQQLAQLMTRRMLEAETARRHAEVIAALGMQPQMEARWVAASRSMLAAQSYQSSVANRLANISKIMRMVLQSAVLTVGAVLVMKQMATGGVLFASSILSSRALAPLDGVIANWRGLLGARQSWDRLKALLHAPAPAAATTWLPAPCASIEVAGLTLGPPGSDRHTAQNISFTAQAGDAVAILGPSGGGKSSLVRGLTGIWPLAEGSVRLDGAALDQWDPAQLGRHIGYVPQAVELIEGTVAQNIARFAPDATSEAVLEAAQAAGVHDLILRLPDGYDTHVGRDGAGLSGGQRQRIALARALYGNPFLIVLDEPNSNLDEEGDAALAQAISNARARGALVLAVAHRPSILRVMNRVLLIKDAQVLAYGDTAKLVPHLLPRPA
jgi:PrtD family type I secretion system ABC transporter